MGLFNKNSQNSTELTANEELSLTPELKKATDEYNNAYKKMESNGKELKEERDKSVELISEIEALINSIAKHPKIFDTAMGKVIKEKNSFKNANQIDDEYKKAKNKALKRGGTGAAAGTAIALIAPDALIWAAGLFGTTSTGVAISTLSGAALDSAILAWLGGGAITAGGLGIAGGSMLLTLIGPIGWTIAGAAALSSAIALHKKKMKAEKEKLNVTESVKKNTQTILLTTEKIEDLKKKTILMRKDLYKLYKKCKSYHGKDYNTLSSKAQLTLGCLVNCTESLSALVSTTLN